MSYDPSGEAGTNTITKGYGQLYLKVVDVQGDRLAGYDLVYRKSGAVDPPRSMVRPKPQKTSRPTPNPAHRDAVRRTLTAAEKEACRLESRAKAGDLMELSNAGFRLGEILRELWELREEREDDWGDLLNILQGALAQEEFERFSVDQCRAIRSIIVDHLGSGAVDVDDLERSIRLLREAGFDPWKGISGETEMNGQVE